MIVKPFPDQTSTLLLLLWSALKSRLPSFYRHLVTSMFRSLEPCLRSRLAGPWRSIARAAGLQHAQCVVQSWLLTARSSGVAIRRRSLACLARLSRSAFCWRRRAYSRLERRYQYCWRENRNVIPMRASQAGPAHSFSAEVVAAILSTRQGNIRRGVCCGTILRSGSMLSCRKCSALPMPLLIYSSMICRLHEKAITRSDTALCINSEGIHAAEGLQKLLHGL